MRILFPLILFLFCSACDNSSSNASDNSSNTSGNNSSNQAAEKPSEELIGKTVNEYQKIVSDEDQSSKSTEVAKSEEGAVVALDEPEIEKGFRPLKWEGLIAPGYDAQSILDKYDPIVSKLQEGSDEANKLYEKMQAEYNKAPPNENLANKKVSIPGFIAPLEQSNGVISEFLLVPYFGACIHSPAPPANQTVHVKVDKKHGINVEDAYDPIWVSGELLIDITTTDIGSASYKVDGAMIKKYDMDN